MNSIKKLSIILLLPLLCASSPIWAQTVNGLPYIEDVDVMDGRISELSPYFSLMSGIRSHSLVGAPQEMELKPWNSSTYHPAFLQFYYSIPTKIPYLTFSIGLRLAQEVYRLKNPNYTLVRSTQEQRTGERKTIIKSIDDSDVAPLKLCSQDGSVEQGQEEVSDGTGGGDDSCIINREEVATGLRVNYIELLLPELRLNTNRQAPESGFSLTIGSVLGIRFRQATQYNHYKEDNELKIATTSESFNLNDFRFGFTIGIGWERVNIFYTQILTGLFQEGMGPSQDKIIPWSVGIGYSLI